MKRAAIGIGTLMMCFTALLSQGQTTKCTTHSRWEKLVEQDPQALERKQALEEFTQAYVREPASRRAVIYVPVVVHVLYNNATQNISEAQVQSQIDVLNEDFRLLNSDALPSSHPFRAVATDTEIEFCLAEVDPNGNATNGINRVQTSESSFDDNSDDMKFTSQGGVDNWDPTKYLNIWVCNFPSSSSTLAFATLPSDLADYPEYDGVVARHEVFGRTGTAGTNGFGLNDGGRTTTHEVGHWFNLEHIWGDANCGNDFVNDTPPQEADNYDCPSFPHNANNSCGGDANGEMYMNYMDYVDDGCMNMFTLGQADRMWAAIDGVRSGLKTANVCDESLATATPEDVLSIRIFPNPAAGTVWVDHGQAAGTMHVTVMDATGRVVHEEAGINGAARILLDVATLPEGVYIVQVELGGNTSVKRLLIQH